MAIQTTPRATRRTTVGENLVIFPYKPGSRSAAALAQGLGEVRRIAHVNSSFRGAERHTVINWGASELPAHVVTAGRILNQPGAVRLATNKRTFFEAAAAAGEEGPRTPRWTTVRADADTWLRDGSARAVLARTVLNGHSGRGIVVIENPTQLHDLPEGTLLVAYQPKRHEFRVHLTRNGIFAVARKARRLDVSDENVNWMIRNHDNGFIFARENVTLPNEDAVTQARRALAVTGLDFGAVDLIYNERNNLSYVLEINTAPGLEGQSVVDYATALRALALAE